MLVRQSTLVESKLAIISYVRTAIRAGKSHLHQPGDRWTERSESQQKTWPEQHRGIMHTEIHESDREGSKLSDVKVK